MMVPLDPDNPDAEDEERQRVEDANVGVIAEALAGAQAEINQLLQEGRLAPAEMQQLLQRYNNNFDQVLAEALRRAARQERSDELQQAHRYAIGRTVDQAAATGLDVAFRQLGNVGINLSYGPLNYFARDWAQAYSYNLITRIDASTGRQVGSAVSSWMETGAHLDALIAQLEPIFGRVRAEAIASTETTRAFAEGTLLGYRQSGLVIATEWKTARDERVCDICWPLRGQRGDLNGNFRHPGGIGKAGRYAGMIFRHPAHVRCRCGIAPIVEMAPTVYPVAKPDEPPNAPYQLQYQPSTEQVAKVNRKVNEWLQILADSHETTPDEIERVISDDFVGLIDRHPMAINFYADNVDALLADGRFKSQFETLRSGGILNLQSRANAEELGLGAPEDLPVQQRPIYGYLRVGRDAERIGYGDVTFVLRDEVKRRATITADDSLYNFAGGEVVGTPATAPTKASWDGWVEALHDHAIGTYDDNDLLGRMKYFEVQVQGGVGISDVSHVIDRGNRLTAKQIEQLRDQGVAIWTSD